MAHATIKSRELFMAIKYWLLSAAVGTLLSGCGGGGDLPNQAQTPAADTNGSRAQSASLATVTGYDTNLGVTVDSKDPNKIATKILLSGIWWAKTLYKNDGTVVNTIDDLPE